MTNTYISPNQREVLYAKGVSGAVPLNADALGNLKVSDVGASGGFPAYDYFSYTNTSSTVDTYVYKTGGAGGTTVATVTITYTDTTKNQISTYART